MVKRHRARAHRPCRLAATLARYAERSSSFVISSLYIADIILRGSHSRVRYNAVNLLCVRRFIRNDYTDWYWKYNDFRYAAKRSRMRMIWRVTENVIWVDPCLPAPFAFTSLRMRLRSNVTWKDMPLTNRIIARFAVRVSREKSIWITTRDVILARRRIGRFLFIQMI